MMVDEVHAHLLVCLSSAISVLRTCLLLFGVATPEGFVGIRGEVDGAYDNLAWIGIDDHNLRNPDKDCAS